jgi:hypothetical protein
MRCAQKRTIDETWRQIGTHIGTIEPDKCDDYFRNAGYASANHESL